MIVSFGPATTEPQKLGRMDDGWVSVQILNGPGLYVGKQPTGLRDSQGPSGLSVYAGMFVTASMGVVNIPWSGEVWVFSPDRVSATYANVELTGCTD